MDRPDRAALLEKLWALGRTMSTQTVFLHQAIAQTIGLNATDTKCVDLILQSRDGALTAGQLSDMSGLTSGAITHILDRLEKRNFIERRRDTADRRKVFVRVRLESIASVIPRYEAIGQAYLALVEQYDDEDLRLICDYLEKTSAMSQRELAKLIAAARTPRAKERN
jgi:DNA-binding MarR family transcriptional regulator